MKPCIKLAILKIYKYMLNQTKLLLGWSRYTVLRLLQTLTSLFTSVGLRNLELALSPGALKVEELVEPDALLPDSHMDVFRGRCLGLGGKGGGSLCWCKRFKPWFTSSLESTQVKVASSGLSSINVFSSDDPAPELSPWRVLSSLFGSGRCPKKYSSAWWGEGITPSATKLWSNKRVTRAPGVVLSVW